MGPILPTTGTLTVWMARCSKKLTIIGADHAAIVFASSRHDVQTADLASTSSDGPKESVSMLSGVLGRCLPGSSGDVSVYS